MNHQLEQHRQDPIRPARDRDLDPVTPEPGQVSRSSLLHRPELAMGMGLGRGAGPGARAMPTARFAARAEPGRSQAGTRELLDQVFELVTGAGSGAPLPGEVSARM